MSAGIMEIISEIDGTVLLINSTVPVPHLNIKGNQEKKILKAKLAGRGTFAIWSRNCQKTKPHSFQFHEYCVGVRLTKFWLF